MKASRFSAWELPAGKAEATEVELAAPGAGFEALEAVLESPFAVGPLLLCWLALSVESLLDMIGRRQNAKPLYKCEYTVKKRVYCAYL